MLSAVRKSAGDRHTTQRRALAEASGAWPRRVVARVRTGIAAVGLVRVVGRYDNPFGVDVALVVVTGGVVARFARSSTPRLFTVRPSAWGGMEKVSRCLGVEVSR
jgi:hypothetical protein